MEEQWMKDRARLRQLMHRHPDWTNRQYMAVVGRSRKWVQKWKKRLQGTGLDDRAVLCSQSRVRKTPPQPYDPVVIERILTLRDEPPEAVPRKLGPLPILYYLHNDPCLSGYRLPRSTSTIWKILNTHQRILRSSKIEHQPLELPPPLDTWEIDFSDVGTAQADHDRKRQHQVEAFAVVDRGTSILIDLQASDDYHAQTAILAMASALLLNGLPRCIILDRDPRLVGSWSADEFPSAFMRFLLNLGITLDVCPARRPDLKPFVERYFRTLKSECVNHQRPTTLMATKELFEKHRLTYNQERPHQGSACGNRPPYVAFPSLPRLATLPEQVDPDHWLQSYHHHLFQRRIKSNGSVQIDKHRYYIKRDLVGRIVLCQLDAQRRVFDVLLGKQLVKTIPIKGLYGQVLDLNDYFELMLNEAVSERRRLTHQRLRCVS